MRRGWTAGVTGGGLAVLVTLAAQPVAIAQAVAAAQVDRQALAQGLQAQYKVSLIRERKGFPRTAFRPMRRRCQPAQPPMRP